MCSQISQTLKSPAHLRGANDNAPPASALATNAGTPLPYPSITPTELETLQPLIKALALMAANDLSATALSSEP
jgi:hypothetical protein